MTGVQTCALPISDASYFAIAGILTQEGRLVACTSKKLKPYQLAYPIREKELLAVVHSLEKCNMLSGLCQ